MAKQKRRDHANEKYLERVLAQAKAEGNKRRKHHLVPVSYLERWEVNGNIRVTDLVGRSSYLTGAESGARETDFYSLAGNEIDPEELPAEMFEVLLSQVEGKAKAAIDKLLIHGPNALPPDDAMDVAMFVSFQFARGRKFREISRGLGDRALLTRTEALSENELRQILARTHESVSESDVTGLRDAIRAWTEGDLRLVVPRPMVVSMAAQISVDAWPFLIGRRWCVYRTDLPLITCDEPVVPVSLEPDWTLKSGGIGKASALLLPLDPNHLLVMFHPRIPLDDYARDSLLLPTETEMINQFIAWNSERWLIESGGNRWTTTIDVPPVSDARVSVEAMKVVGTSGATAFRLRSPRRGSGILQAPEVPIPRWWRLARLSGYRELPFDPLGLPPMYGE